MESEYKQARQRAGRQAGRQAGSETLPIAVVGRGCIDQDEAGRRSLLRLYFRCCPCSCLLALSRKPRSLLPPFFPPFRNLDEVSPQLRAEITPTRNLPSSRKARKPHRFQGSPLIFGSPRRLPRSWIASPFLLSFFLPPIAS